MTWPRVPAATPSDVLVDDIIYFAEPMFQDGIIAQAVDVVTAAGVSYFSSAGNNARDSYEAPLVLAGLGFTGTLHDFDPGGGVDTCQTITLPTGTTFFSFQWAEPYFSVSGGPGSGSDLDIGLFLDAAGCAPGTYIEDLGGVAFNIGGDPVELLGVSNSGSPAAVGLQIAHFMGGVPALLKYVVFSSSAFSIDEFDTASSTIYGHANAAGAEAVGAAFYGDTPEYGTSPPVLESFSSAGPTPIYFDASGLAAFDLRDKPEIVAPDGTNTTFFGFDVELPPDGFPNFFGTSAAAPHAAAVAALMLEAAGPLTPAEVYAALEGTAIDMDAPGFDFDTGFGLIDAALAVGDVAPPVVLPPDVVTILSAEYKADRKELKVRATSSEQPGAVLTLVDFGEMPFKRNKYELKIRPLAAELVPQTVTVVSSLGGTAMAAVVGAPAPPATLVAIAVTPSPASVGVGLTLQFTAIGTFDDASTADLTASASWVSSDGLVASIDAGGLATGVWVGIASISASQNGVTSAPVPLNVIAPPPLVSIAVTPNPGSVAVGQSQQFTATGTFDDDSTEDLTASVTWLSSETMFATIDAAGLATGESEGVTLITATQGSVTSPAVGLDVLAAAGDEVTISKAEWKARNRELKVVANSSQQPGAVLTVVGHGQMTFKKGKYELRVRGVANPGTVTVTSSLGGSATEIVTVR